MQPSSLEKVAVMFSISVSWFLARTEISQCSCCDIYLRACASGRRDVLRLDAEECAGACGRGEARTLGCTAGAQKETPLL